MVRLSLGYPSAKDEMAMVLQRQGHDPLGELTQLLRAEELVMLQEEVAQTYISNEVVKYVVALVNATRNHSSILRGASPRATLAVTAMAKAVARLRGRGYVIPQDVREVFIHTVAHRLLLSAKAESMGVQPRQVLEEILDAVAAPKLR
jgi:MoxR-like ATPase